MAKSTWIGFGAGSKVTPRNVPHVQTLPWDGSTCTSPHISTAYLGLEHESLFTLPHLICEGELRVWCYKEDLIWPTRREIRALTTKFGMKPELRRVKHPLQHLSSGTVLERRSYFSFARMRADMPTPWLIWCVIFWSKSEYGVLEWYHSSQYASYDCRCRTYYAISQTSLACRCYILQ